MTIEEKLKELILSRYKSLREFTIAIDIPYSTMDSILKRGINNASIDNVIKICKALHISVDELAEGRIVPTYQTAPNPDKQDVDALIKELKSKILSYDDLMANGEPVDPMQRIALVDALDTAVEMGKRKTVDNKFLQLYLEYYLKSQEKK